MRLNPSLIIGLGGTGQQVVTYLKKDLLEACGGQLPPQVRLLAFDTVRRAAVKVGGRGEAERGGEAGGTVALDYGEYVYVGGDAYGLVYEADQGEHPQISSWLQASFYLKLSRNILNLEEGAGQFRQLGRLAIFYDVRAPAQSAIYNMLTDAMRSIKRSSGDYFRAGATPRADRAEAGAGVERPSLQVFIVGSLAGGTGSGMFVDMAHLVRKIAELPTVSVPVTVRGYLVLPEAFSTDVDVSMMKSLQGRAHAAMRETRRFTLNFEYKLGYPIYYHDRGTDPVWRGVVRTKLFDLLYYVDGQRVRNSLADVPLKHGVAPTLADAISATLDAEDPERPFQAYPLNVEAEVSNRRSRGDLEHDAATFGSVGTYTLVFPIHSLIKGWSHQLALEVLDRFLPPPKDPKTGSPLKDPKTGLPLSLADDANAEEEGVQGSEGARRFMQSTQIIDPFNTENQVNLTLLLAELGAIGRRYLNKDPDLMGELLDRDLKGWNDYFEPAGDDEVSINARLQARAVLSASLIEGDQKIKTSDEQKEAPTQGAPRIEEEVRNFKNVHLGREDPTTGQRSGGKYREKLETYVNLHLERFQQALDLQILIILNGRSRDNFYQARCGKLGYLRSFLDQLYRDLDAANQVLNEVRTRRQLEGDRRKDAIAAARKALKTMKDSSAKKVPILGTYSKEAYETQREYLAKEQALVDLLRSEIMEQAVLDTVGRMIAYVEATRQQVRSWTEALALDRNSLYSQVLAGLQEVKSDRQVDRQVAVRHVVENEEYEKTRYNVYVSGGDRDAVRDVLSGLTWELGHTKTRGIVSPELILKIRVPEETKPVAAEAQTDTRHNLNLLLAACRPAFERAMQDESIVDYLMYEYPQPEVLAEHIYNQSGPLLSYSGGNPLPANYLRVYYNREKPEQSDYVNQVLARLTQLNNVGVGATDARRGQTFAKVVSSGDRFKCSLIHTEEIIELDKIEAFRNSRTAYLSGAEREGANRSTLHLFPAEVNAIRYEERLGELNQAPRLFSDRVVIQLEKLDNFRTFMFCYVYGLIERYTMGLNEPYPNQVVWRLVLPAETEFDRESDRKEKQIWWLTDPKKEPNMIDAMMTFNFIGDEVGHEDGYTHPIPYDRVEVWLKHVRQQDAKDRIGHRPDDDDPNREPPRNDEWLKGKVGTSFDHLTADLAAIEDRERLWNARLFAAQIDRLKGWYDRLSNQVRGQGRPSDQTGGQNFDLACIFVLMLSDEIKKLRQGIKDLKPGGAVFEEKPPVSPVKPRFDPF